MKKKLLITCIYLLGFNSLFAQDTFKAMFYNLLNFPLQSIPADRIDHLEIIMNDTQPDIFMVCELNNASGANSILNLLQDINENYAMTTFELNSSDDDFGDQNDLQNLLFFDDTKFILESQHKVPTQYRDFNHYRLKLNTVDQDTNPLYLDVIVGHLKSSDGTANQTIRLAMVQDLTDYLTATLDADSHVLFGGDLNLYRSSEPAFQVLTSTDNFFTFVDPAHTPTYNSIGSWHSNPTQFIKVLTQSTRTTSGMGGATGGFDDRFDFILTSDTMDNTSGDNSDLFFVEESYQVYGNNNNVDCYNQALTSNDCDIDGDASTPDFSAAIRNALFNFSDHLPVTLQVQADQEFLSIPEYNTLAKYYEIIGTNIVSNTIHLHTNNQLLTTKKLNVFNTLGQLVQTIPVSNSETHAIDVSTLSNGLYYITTPNLNVEPLKFVKVN